MKAVAIEVTAERATVVLTPGWVRRLFGARELVIELEWCKDGRGVYRHGVGWYAIVSSRPLSHLEHGVLIQRALDFRPRGDVPRAITRQR